MSPETASCLGMSPQGVTVLLLKAAVFFLSLTEIAEKSRDAFWQTSDPKTSDLLLAPKLRAAPVCLNHAACMLQTCLSVTLPPPDPKPCSCFFPLNVFAAML